MKTIEYRTKDGKIFTTSPKNKFFKGILDSLKEGENLPYKLSDLYYICHYPEIPENKIISLVLKFNHLGVAEIKEHLIKNINRIFDVNINPYNHYDYFLNWFENLCKKFTFKQIQKKMNRAFFLEHYEDTVWRIRDDVNNIYDYEYFDSKIKYIVKKKNGISDEIIKYYIDHYLDLEYDEGQGYAMVHYICRVSKPEIIKYIIDKGIGLECEDEYKNRPIHYICMYSTPEMLKYIVGKGVNLECEGYHKMRPIHYICKFSTPEMLKYIIDKGVNIECETAGKLRPIHYICKYSTPEMLKYIVDKGVDLEYGIESTMDLAHFICEKSNPEIKKFFIDKVVDLNSEKDLKNIILY